jgi:hypothetical protein
MTTDVTISTTLDITSEATASVTETVTADVTNTATTDLTTVQTNTETVDITSSQTVTQTAEVTSTETTSVTATETSTTTVDVTEVATITSTSFFGVTTTQPVTLQSTIVNTVDITNTAFTTSTIDVTTTQTVSTTTTTTITSTVTSSPTCGVNRVSNPGFDGATLTPWTWTSTGNGHYQWVTGMSSTAAIDLYTIGAGSSTSLIKQSLSTSPGKTYTVSFYAAFLNGNGASTLQVSVDNSVTTTSTYNIGASAKGVWKTFQSTFVASSSSTLITFKLTTPAAASVYLDQISVMC